MKRCILFAALLMVSLVLNAQYKSTVKLGLLKYKGGGDWYANPTALPNLAKFCNKELGMDISPDIDEVEPGSSAIFSFPFLHMTGHGNVVFTSQEVSNLRKYLIAGGFLHVSDNYGMDTYIRRELKKIFPELELTELPADHPIYHQKFNFPNGLPKIHEHDGKPARGYALIYEGRVVCFYDYECDLSDGWEDPQVHKDSEAARSKALQMGANLVSYAMLSGL